MELRTIDIEDMNWCDVKEAISAGYDTAVLAIGSMEQHGPHLPIKTDSAIGEALALGVANQLGNALKGPTIRLGCSRHHLSFAGTVSVSPETLLAVLSDYIDSLCHHGFRTIVILASHGGNFAPVNQALESLRKSHPKHTILFCGNISAMMDVMFIEAEKHGISKEQAGVHAGDLETSIMLALEPSQVQVERCAAGFVDEFGSDAQRVIGEEGIIGLSKSGVLGDPTQADDEKGWRYLTATIDHFVEVIRKDLQAGG